MTQVATTLPTTPPTQPAATAKRPQLAMLGPETEKQLLIRKINGEWQIDFSSKDPNDIITPRELNIIERTVRIKYKQERQRYNLTVYKTQARSTSSVADGK